MGKFAKFYPSLLEKQHLPIPSTFGIVTIFEIKPKKLPYKEFGYHFILPSDEYDVDAGDQYASTDLEFKKAQQMYLEKLRRVHDEMMTFSETKNEPEENGKANGIDSTDDTSNKTEAHKHMNNP